MNKRTFNLAAVVILVFSLIYVPTTVSNGELTAPTQWTFIFVFDGVQSVDLVRLMLEELAIGILLFGIWQFVLEE